MTILTQDKVLVNYDNVISINLMEVNGKNDDDEEITYFEMTAKTVAPNQAVSQSDEPTDVITLGVYLTKQHLLDAFTSLSSYLKYTVGTYENLFEMPDFDYEED